MASDVERASSPTDVRVSAMESFARRSWSAVSEVAPARSLSASATLSLSVSATTELTVETNSLLIVSSRVDDPASVTFGETGLIFSFT